MSIQLRQRSRANLIIDMKHKKKNAKNNPQVWEKSDLDHDVILQNRKQGIKELRQRSKSAPHSKKVPKCMCTSPNGASSNMISSKRIPTSPYASMWEQCVISKGKNQHQRGMY